MAVKKKESVPAGVEAPPVAEKTLPELILEKLSEISTLRLEEGQKRMVAAVVELAQTPVKQIMTPRPEMACAEEGSTPEEVRQLVKEKGHSRIPLYKKEIDHISGILHLRDLFVAEQTTEKVELSKLARKAHFVPENKKLDDLLVEMRREKTHIAIVVDEYGGIAGLVTIEDIIEEIVGEIQDEYVAEEPDIQRLDEHTILVRAKVSLKEINEALGSKLPEDKFESVAGLIYDKEGGVPEAGKVIRHKNLKFEVEKLDGQRIKWVKVSRGK